MDLKPANSDNNSSEKSLNGDLKNIPTAKDLEILNKMVSSEKDTAKYDLPNQPSFRRILRIFAVILIVIIILVLFYFYTKIASIQVDNTQRGTSVNKGNTTSENAFFVPESRDPTSSTYVGNIDYASDVTGNAQVKHRLTDQEGNTIYYLSSSSNDLNLSVGLQVEIIGTIKNEEVNGFSVLEVEKIKLK